MKGKKLDLIDIIEEAGLSDIKMKVYIDILPLYASIEQRTKSQDDALHHCARYLHKHRDHYQTLINYELRKKNEGSL